MGIVDAQNLVPTIAAGIFTFIVAPLFAWWLSSRLTRPTAEVRGQELLLSGWDKYATTLAERISDLEKENQRLWDKNTLQDHALQECEDRSQLAENRILELERIIADLRRNYRLVPKNPDP